MEPAFEMVLYFTNTGTRTRLKIFQSLAHQQNTQQQTKIYLFYSAFYISLNRRYSTGTTNIGETNRIYTYYQY